MAHPYIRLPISVLLAALLAATTSPVSATCFWQNSTLAPDSPESIAPDDTACFPDQESSSCCGTGWTCLSDGVCYIEQDDSSFYYRGTCTDRTWDSQQCPGFCFNINSNTSIPLAKCSNGGANWYCCPGDPDCNCATGFNAIKLGALQPTTVTVIGSTSWPGYTRTSSSTSTPTSTSSSSTNSPTASTASTASAVGASAASSQPPSSSSAPVTSSSSQPNTGLAAGLGAGLGIAALLVAVLIFFLVRSRRRRRGRESDVATQSLYKLEMPADEPTTMPFVKGTSELPTSLEHETENRTTGQAALSGAEYKRNARHTSMGRAELGP